MLSRVADSLYWMSRYLERAEHSARLLGVHLNLMLEHDVRHAGERWQRVMSLLGNKEPVEDDAFHAALVFVRDQIVTLIAEARENARQVREQISSEMWEEINRLYHEMKRTAAPEQFVLQPVDAVMSVLRSSHLIHGLTDSTMLHGEGWQFIQTGRFIERTQHVAKLVDSHFATHGNESDLIPPSQHMEWLGVLRSCTAFEAYCKVYTAEIRPDRVAEFLLLNAEFPYSVRFCAEQLRQSLESIHHLTRRRKSDRLAKLAGRLTSAVSYTPLDEILLDLHDFSSTIRKLCGQIHAGVYQVYITYPIEAALEA